jgi:hypothetical protein
LIHVPTDRQVMMTCANPASVQNSRRMRHNDL